MKIQSINYLAPKYFLPLIALPFVGFLGYQSSKLFAGSTTQDAKETALLDDSLGESRGELLSKKGAYEAYKNATMKEPDLFFREDSLSPGAIASELPTSHEALSSFYGDSVDENQKEPSRAKPATRTSPAHSSENASDRDWIRKFNEWTLGRPEEGNASSVTFPRKEQLPSAVPSGPDLSAETGRDYSYARENPLYSASGNASSSSFASHSNSQNYGGDFPQENSSNTSSIQPALDPARMLKEQLLVMDSLEKSRDPEFQKEQQALLRIEANEKLKKKFLESREKVTRQKRSSAFSSIYRKEEQPFFRATIDEDRSGYLGSRFRIRLLEDLWIGEKKLKSGTLLYAHISGFSLERVALTIVSVFSLGEVQSVELEIYDLDGQKGLYVPGSDYREMIKELGMTSLNGNPMVASDTSFYTSLLSSAFRSASSSAARMIRTNKARLKYGTLVYLKDAS